VALPEFGIHSPMVSFSVKVQPNASKTCVAGKEGDLLKIRLAAPPVDGTANEALIEFLSKKLGVAKCQVTIRSGLSSRRKLVQVEGCSERRFRDFSAEFG